MGEYPTQEYVKGLMAAGKWPAKDGEVIDHKSLSDKEISFHLVDCMQLQNKLDI